ncbi:hypothetical protein Y032_0285g1367 [Ancylostoma ceylanicum]|nr:hypothetical protein Y032_0285g1367 [Ancylostoma ceylanicum]
MMIKTVYAMIQPVLSKQTREKVTFLGNDWKDVLLKELGAHNIYSHWGGTKPSELPTGDIRMGGKVPEKLQYKAEDNVQDNKKGFEKVNVSARSKTEENLHDLNQRMPILSKDRPVPAGHGGMGFEFDVIMPRNELRARKGKRFVDELSDEQVKVWGEKGRTFRWIWRVSSGDVDFGIQKDGQMVYPTFRITTEFHPEIGSMECRETGDYTFFFDNSHGKVWSKDVSYKISLE